MRNSKYDKTLLLSLAKTTEIARRDLESFLSKVAVAEVRVQAHARRAPVGGAGRGLQQVRLQVLQARDRRRLQLSSFDFL